ncbi:MAG: hypothetical protein ACOCV2_05320, partial [Persicimonas sp.]
LYEGAPIRGRSAGAVESGPSVDVIRTRFGPIDLAIELHRVSSVLDYQEAQGMPLIDPAPKLGMRPLGGGHVGYIEPERGAPVGVLIGEVQAFSSWTPANLVRLPDWLAGFLPDVLEPVCGRDEISQLVWLLDLAKVLQHNG